MYEMLVGENPFKITKEEELMKIITDTVVFPIGVNLSTEAIDFIQLCLEKKAINRVGIR